MKKALVILLILAVAGGAFAQGLAFTGLVRSGVALQFNDGADKPDLGFWSVKNGYGARLDLNGTYTNEAGNAGAKFNLRVQGDADGKAGAALIPITSDYAFAWLKVLDGMVTFNGGDISTGSYGTGGGIDSSLDTGGGLGAMVQIAPITGLEFGTGVYYLDRGAAVDGNFDVASDLRYNFGFTFTAEKLVTVIGNFAQGANAYNDTDAILGFKVLALADMGFTALNVDFGFDNIQSDGITAATIKTVKFGEKVEWTDSTILAGVRFLQQIQVGDAAGDPDLTFSGYGSYDLGGIVPRLDVGFNLGAAMVGTPRNSIWDGTGKGGFNADNMNLAIAPSVQFRIDGTGKFIELGYLFQKDLTDGSDDMRNTVYVDFNVAF